ncbi:hypothetical protein C2W62_11430 [Candidatus Entotheonella serta]|nr:hypothetical protein C2W62_11430 [Candidatus Entotheonella serta]
MRRTARLGNGWYPIGSNPQFPMGAPQQLKAGLERLNAFFEAEGRDPAEIDIIYRSHTMDLTTAPPQPVSDRRLWVPLTILRLIFGNMKPWA